LSRGGSVTTNQLIEAAARKSFQILIVDDSPEDIRLIKDAFSLWKSSRTVQTCLNGMDALDCVKSARDGDRPDLIVLDWNLPGMKGEQVLEHLKKDRAVSNIPVVVFTSSSAPSDKARATQLGAERFITKPLDIDEFFNVIAGLEDLVKTRGR